jgi:hypothetical protein
MNTNAVILFPISLIYPSPFPSPPSGERGRVRGAFLFSVGLMYFIQIPVLKLAVLMSFRIISAT